MKTRCFTWLVGVTLLLLITEQLSAQGTAFVYHGELSQRGRPARGEHDLRFALYDAATNGTQIATQELPDVRVQDGEFTVTLDFGAGAFDGAARWLEISVKQRRSDDFIPLRPRQKIMPVPYAIMAGTASNLLGTVPASQIAGPIPASQLSGPLPATALSGTYSAPVNLDNAANQFSGDGSQLANVNAASLNGLSASNFWQLGGNANTTPEVNFLGTTDERALELKVNNLRALRIEPGSNGVPNVIGGNAGNFVGSMILTGISQGSLVFAFYPTGIFGATISGGGNTSASNVIASDFGTIAGGAGNSIERRQPFSVISGGFSNKVGYADPSFAYSAIGGGCSNVVYSTGSAIGGGIQNRIGQSSSDSRDQCHVIAGGFQNRIGYQVGFSTIGGGSGNFLDAQYATIAGGRSNYIGWAGQINGDAIGGGVGNYILSSGPPAGIVVGNETERGYATISGGRSNRITAAYGSIPGGFGNTVSRGCALAAGYRAQAVHSGAFVWADISNAEFPSASSNSFSVRATGGTRFVSAVDSNGIPTAGVELPAGGGAWATLSDRDSKENFAPVDSREVLQRVNQMPISNWNYKSQDKTIRHIGPTAQDFAAAFEVGESAQRITTVDADGVALAAIQGLSQIVKEKDAKIERLDTEVTELQHRIAKLEQLLNQKN